MPKQKQREMIRMSVRHYLLSLLILLCALSAQAKDLGGERGWVEDPSGKMTLSDVKQAVQTPLENKLFSKGYSQSFFWIRIHIDPSDLLDQKIQNLVIRIRPPYQDQIWMFDPLAQSDQERVTGDYYDWAEDEYRSLNLNFVIPVGTEPRDVWLKIKSSASTLTFIEVMTPDQVRAADRIQEIATMLYLSALFVCFGWSLLARINRKDKLLSFYLIRELVVIVYALAILGYLRVFSSGWLPAGWLDHSTNLIAFVFIATIICFDWQLIREFKPNKWIARLHGALVLFLPIQIVLVIMGKSSEAIRLSSLEIALTIILSFVSAISTRAWALSRHAPKEEKPICSKGFLVLIYGVAASITLLHRLPLMGVSSGSDLFVYLNLVYPLLTSITLMILIQTRLYRSSIYQQETQRRLELAELDCRKEKNQREEQANFLKMLAHEMKTPLTVVRMAVGSKTITAKTHEVVDRAVTEMDSIIERLLQVDRLEDERIDIRHQEMDLSDTVKELILLISESERDRIHLVTHGEMIFRSDLQLVRVIISNLLENAIKYSPNDSPVNITLRGSEDQASIAVENRAGIAGFPSEGQVFEKYYRSPLAHQRTGSGLGLYLVKALVTLLGGSVRYVPMTQTVRFEVDLPRKG